MLDEGTDKDDVDRGSHSILADLIHTLISDDSRIWRRILKFAHAVGVVLPELFRLQIAAVLVKPFPLFRGFNPLFRRQVRLNFRINLIVRRPLLRNTMDAGGEEGLLKGDDDVLVPLLVVDHDVHEVGGGGHGRGDGRAHDVELADLGGPSQHLDGVLVCNQKEEGGRKREGDGECQGGMGEFLRRVRPVAPTHHPRPRTAPR